jgi:hypothetical protein
MGHPGIFLLSGVLMGHCVSDIAVYVSPAIFLLSGMIMGHCVGEIAVYGPPSYFSFIVCANGTLCR